MFVFDYRAKELELYFIERFWSRKAKLPGLSPGGGAWQQCGRQSDAQRPVHYLQERCQTMRAKPGHWVWEWLERYGIKMLKTDSMVKENRIKCLSRTSIMINLQDCDTISQVKNAEEQAGMKLYSKEHRQISSPVDL